MPEMIPPEAVTLCVEHGEPVIRIAGARAREVDGWGFLHRRTLVIIDGPGDEGFLVPRAVAADAPDPDEEEWDAALSTATTVKVRFTDTGQEIDAEVLRD